jgi:hypothetical protein
LTSFHIRLLSKSPLLATEVANELDRRFPDPETGAKKRIIFGLSTGILEDQIAEAIEQHVPPPSKRLEALRRLQDEGFRTFGMLCPILPQPDGAAYRQYAADALDAIRADRCEQVWAEVLNFRAGGKSAGRGPEEQRQRDSFTATRQALRKAGLQEKAALVEHVASDDQAWEEYARATFEALVNEGPKQNNPSLVVGEKLKATEPNKLRFLQYPRNFARIAQYWDAQQVNGAVLLGGIVTGYRKALQAGQARATVGERRAHNLEQTEYDHGA